MNKKSFLITELHETKAKQHNQTHIFANDPYFQILNYISLPLHSLCVILKNTQQKYYVWYEKQAESGNIY